MLGWSLRCYIGVVSFFLNRRIGLYYTGDCGRWSSCMLEGTKISLKSGTFDFSLLWYSWMVFREFVLFLWYLFVQSLLDMINIQPKTKQPPQIKKKKVGHCLCTGQSGLTLITGHNSRPFCSLINGNS